MTTTTTATLFGVALTSLVGEWSWARILVQLILIGLIAAVAYFVLRAFNRFVVRVYHGRGRWRAAVLRGAPLVRFGFFALLIVVVGTILFEISTPMLAVALLALAVALGLGSVDLVRNILSGAVIGVQRPFTVNDRVRVGEIEGDILGIGIRSTAMRASDGSIVHVPNHKFLAGVVVNSSLPQVGSPTRFVIPVPAGVDIAAAKDVAYRSACICKYASPRRRPQVRVEHNTAAASAHSTHGEPVLALELLAYAFNPRYESHLRGEIIELVNEGLAALARRRTSPAPPAGEPVAPDEE